MLGKARPQRLEPPGRAAHPARQRRAAEPHALAGEDPGLPVEWEMVGVFAHQHMREKRRHGHPLGDRPLGGGRLMDGPAGAAGKAWAAHAQDARFGRHMVEHLACGLADRMQRTSAAGAELSADPQHLIHTGKVMGQARPVLWGPGLPHGPARCLLEGRLRAGEVGAQVLPPKLEMIVWEPLGAAAEARPLQGRHLLAQPLDLGLSLCPSDPSGGGQRADQAVRRRDIVRQGGEVDLHARG